jgi:tetratricopeptide (TPR) repeat protein
MRAPWLFLAAGLALLPGCSRIVLLHDPLTAQEHNDLGVAYESTGRLELAEREYKKSLRRDRGFALAWVNLGNVAAARGRMRDAERCYRKALRWRPDDADALNNLAVTLARQGRELEEAEGLALRALELGGGSVGRDSLYGATLAEVRKIRRDR